MARHLSYRDGFEPAPRWPAEGSLTRLSAVLAGSCYALEISAKRSVRHCSGEGFGIADPARYLLLGSAPLNRRLYRAYLLSQQLREIYRTPLDQAIALLEAWLKWARRSRLAPFVKLARTITEQRPGIEAAIRHRLSNACLSYCTSW
jgi:Transposase